MAHMSGVQRDAETKGRHGVKMHPGIAYVQGLDEPMRSTLAYHIVQLDIPVTF
jgi:hypothetical protein